MGINLVDRIKFANQPTLKKKITLDFPFDPDVIDHKET